MKTIVLSFALSALLAVPAPAQNSRPPEQIDLTIHPAAPDEPALKHRLVPDLSEQTPGNAATLYLMAFSTMPQLPADVSLDQLLNGSTVELAADKARKVADTFRATIDRIELAGRRSYCDWDPAYREQGFEALLPFLNSARQVASVLAIDARLAIREHRYDEAIRNLRTGFTLARDVNQNPVVVQSLVAVQIQSVMLDVARMLAQEPGAPNLYWPLVNVPSPGDQRTKAVQLERAMLFYEFPALKHPEQLSAQESRRVVQLLGRWANESKEQALGMVALGMIRVYPEARKFLIARGMDPRQVEALPANSVVLAYDLQEFTRLEDAVEKWLGLPLWQAYEGVWRDEQEFSRQGPSSNPFVIVLPAYDRAVLQFIRVERQRAMTEIVEGIRAYAATHQGAFPKSLNDLLPQTPAPLDPLTGQAFEYTVKGDTATLRGAPPTREAFIDQVYRIRLEP